MQVWTGLKLRLENRKIYSERDRKLDEIFYLPNTQILVMIKVKSFCSNSHNSYCDDTLSRRPFNTYFIFLSILQAYNYAEKSNFVSILSLTLKTMCLKKPANIDLFRVNNRNPKKGWKYVQI